MADSRAQVEEFGAEIREERVESVGDSGDEFTVVTEGGD
jgi:thioredoxin reductase